MSEVRKKAMKAAYDADAPKRAEEERQRREREEADAEIKRQSLAFERRAKTHLSKRLKIGTRNWVALETHPTYCVLRDPTDDSVYGPLTLTVTSWHAKPKNRLRILFAPDKNYGKDYTNNREGDGIDWHAGPEISDMLSLGRAIQQYEKHERDIWASMPDHLP